MAKKWTKAEREAASIAGKKRWAARKKQDVRFSTASAPPSDGFGLATVPQEAPISPKDEVQVLAMMLDKERAWRSSVAGNLISIANELLNAS